MNRFVAWRAPAGALLVLAALCGAWIADARAETVPAEEAKAPEPLESELIRARNMIINASSRVRNDLVGVGRTPDGPDTFGRSCCSNNLEKIESAIDESARILEELDLCYEREGDTDMVLRARVAQSELSEFARTLPGLADSRGKREAEAAIRTMSRAYNALRSTAVELRPCEGVSPPPEANADSSGAKAKKSRKKDEPGREPRKD